MDSLTDNIVSTSLSKKIAVRGFWQEAWGKVLVIESSPDQPFRDWSLITGRGGGLQNGRGGGT